MFDHGIFSYLFYVNNIMRNLWLRSQILKKYKPVSNLSFLSKIIENIISICILVNNGVHIGQATVVRRLYFVWYFQP